MKTIAILAAAAAAMFAIPAASAAPVAAAPIAPIAATAIAGSGAALVSVQDRRHRNWRGHGRRAYWRTVCTRKWRHGRSVRVCRKVRGWR
ncbi:MAG: hypothetical protein EOP36_12680 [Rubrivivax sp.]|nr:MAG: hypothetical protein EOP36_12680 [Rubrivivax sp.]